MAGLNCDLCAGQLTISGEELLRDAWCVINLPVLWPGAAQRGVDRVLPGVTGVLAFQRRATVTAYTLEMAVTGEVDSAGAINADPWEGFQDNVDYLRDNIVDPPGSGDGTRPAVLTLPDGSTRTGDLHVVRFAYAAPTVGVSQLSGADVVAAPATLSVSIPAGELT